MHNANLALFLAAAVQIIPLPASPAKLDIYMSLTSTSALSIAPHLIFKTPVHASYVITTVIPAVLIAKDAQAVLQAFIYSP